MSDSVTRSRARANPAWIAAGVYVLLALIITAQQTIGHAQSNNFAIFRSSFWHLLQDRDLYTTYPAEHFDLFKYSPTFALLCAPFAVLPYGLGLLLWNLINAGALVGGVLLLLPARAAMAALAIALLEAVGALQNTQSNALIAGLMILSLVALERQSIGGGAAAVVMGASIKVYPLGAGLLGLVSPQRWRHLAWCAAIGILFLLAPLLVTSPDMLASQYRGWVAVQARDTAKVGMGWIGGLVELAVGRGLPHAPFQLGGVLWVTASAVFARAHWGDPAVRRLLLASLLIFMLVFNHMAESPTFVIAYAGLGIWWASLPRAGWRDALVLAIVLLGSVGGSSIVPRSIRAEWHDRTQLKAIMTLIGWCALQVDLWRLVRDSAPATPTQPA